MNPKSGDRSLAGIFLGGWLCAFGLLRTRKTEAFQHQPTNLGRHFHFDQRRTQSHKLSRTTLPNLFSSPLDPTSDQQEQRSSIADAEVDDIDPAAADDDEDFKAWVASRVKQWPRVPSSERSSLDINAQVENKRPIDFNNNNNKAGTMDAIGGLLRSAKSVVSEDALSRVLGIETLLELARGASLSTYAEASFDPTLLVSNQTKLSLVDNNNNNNNENKNATTTSSTGSLINAAAASALEELSEWNKWVVGALRPNAIGKSAEGLLRQATMSMESLVTEASSAVRPDTIQALIRVAGETLRLSQQNTTTQSGGAAMELGGGTSAPGSWNVTDDRLGQATVFAKSFLATADGLLRKGYVFGDPITQRKLEKPFLVDVPAVAGSRALFQAFETAHALNVYSKSLVKAAEMGALAGAIYEETLPRTQALSQTIVARGVTQDVAWMVTDSLANQSSFRDEESVSSSSRNEATILVRTITIRGYDASDESIDRELLLNRICTAEPQTIKRGIGVQVHAGLLEIAEAIFEDVRQYIDWTAPLHKIVLNGHSIGGSLSLLLLMLIRNEYGADFTRSKVLKVYTFGSPPIARLQGQKSNRKEQCDILNALQLPTSVVHGFCQPLDPILRLFSEVDALYPLVNDLGPDGNTPFADGPPRALRPITKALLESWDGWPRFRESFRGTANQTFTSMGVQHLMLPSPTRYLADRFVAVNIPVPPVATVLRISSKEVYPALKAVFPLDVFEISYIPQAIRSFVHHFYPAYGFPLVDYVKELERQSLGLPERKSEFAFSEKDFGDLNAVSEMENGAKTDSESPGGIDWGLAVAWLTRNEAQSS